MSTAMAPLARARPCFSSALQTTLSTVTTGPSDHPPPARAAVSRASASNAESHGNDARVPSVVQSSTSVPTITSPNPAEPSAPTKPVDTTASTVNADSTASAPTRAAWNPIPVLSRCISTASERPISCGKEPSRLLRIALSPARTGASSRAEAANTATRRIGYGSKRNRPC